MHEVFINYRTGDGDKTAALLDEELKRRFGRDRIFRASRSIHPGEAFPEKLLTTVRRTSLLLAVVGPDWANFHSRLNDPEDWVRKEIEEAFACEALVVPILDGRKTNRLSKADLPDALARLADLQSVPFDTQDAETGLLRVGDLVADLVLGLTDLDEVAKTEAGRSTGSVTNSVDDMSGTAVQSRDFTGDVGGTVVKDTRGPVHTGGGNIYQNSRHVSGGRHFSGNGMTYFEGDNHGGIQHRYDAADRREDDGR
ncbi:TIR domain-containing protein [Streptomyces sp. SID8366]|uniref:TIR domain-containing protein n=1 Tax=unclassified Streptomyces TaxID=2593676 RepID=UPI000DB8FA19|nr:MULTISPECIES: TIR domain-containing protein [unclassified Streptomyces]MYU05028.1 TIR domain-containing protein [Streptomyces sp. SID8366]MYU64167.1 TIR domain-containing protein [Streptomyces sp. SID69]RAJ65899.1 TIR domain-containing protein [Streptomyces sp. PsTaAH-130]